jgi:hypothetical protein
MVKKTSKPKNFNFVSNQEQLKFNFFTGFLDLTKSNSINNNNLILNMNDLNSINGENAKGDFKLLEGNSMLNLMLRTNNKKQSWENLSDINPKINNFLINGDYFFNRKESVFLKNFFFNFFSKMNDSNLNPLYNYNDVVEVTRFSKRSQGINSPVRLIKYPISNKTNFDLSSEIVNLFKLRFNDVESSPNQKPAPHTTFLTLKQKRYKRKKIVLPRTIFYKNEMGDRTKKLKYSAYPYLHQNKIILENFDDATKQYRLFRKNKVRHELTNLVLSKRMLRTRRTLVLPAHVNLTAVTNSYDVMHS